MAFDATDIKELLIRHEVISFQMLNEILSEHEKTNVPVLEILIRKQEFDSKKLLKMFTDHYGYTPVNPSIFVLDDETLGLIPKDFAEKNIVLPISRRDKSLTVAFANPTHIKLIDDLQAMTRHRIKVVVADAKLIPQLIKKNYESKPGLASNVTDLASGVQKGEALDDIVKMIEGEQDVKGPSESDLLKVAFETPVIKIVNNLLAESIQRRASDIFIEPWESQIRVRSRVDGMLEEIIKTPKALGDAIVSRIKVMSQLNIAEHRVPQDGRFKVKTQKKEVDMRVSILPTCHGEKVCLRVLDTSGQAHDISKLGFDEREQQVIKDSARCPNGMILVTGPTGSGKTTTLYSVLKYLDSPEVNITTVEDPVEYQLKGINQVNVREQVGLTFPASLRSILRQDPDIILIGEIRDADTLDIAVKAALTGHLVLSTLHTNDAISSIIRMVNMGLEPFLIASTVLMISAQRLVRKVCPKCKTQQDLDQEVLLELGMQDRKDVKFFKGSGCAQCRHTGYSGRSVITEIARITPAIRQAIMSGANAETIKSLAQSEGMTTLRECAVRKALAGETTLDEVFRVTTVDRKNPAAKKSGSSDKKEAA